MLKFFSLSFLALAPFLNNVRAADVFSFILPPCKIISGVPLDKNDGGLIVLSTDGKIHQLVPEEISGLAHYVVPQSQYQAIDFPKETLSYLKQIEIKDSDQNIVGFPYYFTEEVIFVLDGEGRRIVVGEEELGRITLHRELPKHKKSPVAFAPTKLALPAGLEECGNKSAGVLPMRLSTDKVQIQELVTLWEQGFKKINDLAERTDFYPRPHMFDKSDRVGFYAQEMPDGERTPLPLRIRLVNGKDFQFQGETFFGGGLDLAGPRSLPMEILSTELKFHFLHALFVGNLNGMAMGASNYTRDPVFTDRLVKRPDKASSDTSFNHFALIGADWKKFGLHVGPLFPVVYLQNGPEAREVRPRKAFPMGRLTWTGEKLKVQASMSKGEVNVSDDVGKRASILSSDFDENPAVDSFRFNFQFFRTGVTWSPDPEWELGVNWLHWDWQYNDSSSGGKIKFDSTRDSLMLLVKRDFGDYVSLSIDYILEIREEDGRAFKNQSRPRSIGGAFEFLF